MSFRSTGRKATFSELMMADIQPGTAEDHVVWDAIQLQLKKHHRKVDMVTISGDLLARGTPDPEPGDDVLLYTFADLFSDLAKCGVTKERLFTTTGNHDYNYGPVTYGPNTRMYHEYLRYNHRLYFYSVWGNVVRIHMGDMYISTQGEIPDYVLEWCEEIIERHRHHVIILYIHQPLLGTLGITGTDDLDNNNIQLGSDRIIAMLERQAGKIALLVSGHVSHATSGGLTNAGVTSHEFKHGCWHVNVGLHIPSFRDYPANPISFCRMELTHGSKFIRVRRWNCLTQQYVASKSFTIQAQVPVELASRPTYDGRYQFDERNRLIELDPGKPLRLAMQAPRLKNTGGVWTVEDKPIPMFEVILQDRSTDDIPDLVGPSMDFYVPGGGASEGNRRALASFGLGARIAAQKASTADVSYQTNLNFYTQSSVTAEKTEATLAQVLGALSTGYTYVVNRLGVQTIAPQGLLSTKGQNAGGPALYFEGSSQDIAGTPDGVLQYGAWNGTTFTLLGTLE